MAPELVWGLVPRIVGLLYVLGFGALIFQHSLMPGIAGFAQTRAMNERIRRDYPGIRRFFDFPGLLWLFDSDRAQQIMPVVGTLCGFGVIYGGTLGYACLIVAAVLWLSLESRGLIFPWDTMLQEVGFLALFLPIVPTLPSFSGTELPLPSVAFAVRWMVLRLMIGFGKEKFYGALFGKVVGTTKSDRLYLRGFFVWMPLPTPLGWLAHHAPAWLLKGMLGFMFFAEMVAPILGLFAGPLRIVSFVTLVGLMAGIHATGNWGFFNIGYALLCICLLDVNSSIFDLAHEPWASELWTWPNVAVHATMFVLFLVSLFYLPNSSWFTRSWVNWPADMFPMAPKWRQLAARIHRALEPLRWLAPFRIVNGYGVFPPHAIAPVRLLPVLEGSDDGVTWHQYGYRHMPSFPHSRPPFIAPYHARFDQLTYYVTLGIEPASLFGSLFPFSNPYLIHTRTSAFDLLVQRVLQHEPNILRAFSHNPFPDRPPKQIRVGVIGMTPARLSDLRKTGNWWHVRRFGTLLQARGVESWPEKLAFPEPELFHPDLVAWKRRAKPLREMVQAFEQGMSAERAVLVCSDLSSADVERFWSELVPMLAEGRGDWSRIHEREDAIVAHFGVEGLTRLERVLERFIWLLRLRTDPHQSGAQEPSLPGISNFRYHLILQELLTYGRETYEAYLAEPVRIVEFAARSSEATQLWAMGLLRYEQVMAQLYTYRGSEMGEVSAQDGMPSFFEYYYFLVKLAPRDEEFCPKFVKHPDGEYTIEGFYPPPALAAEPVAPSTDSAQPERGA